MPANPVSSQTSVPCDHDKADMAALMRPRTDQSPERTELGAAMRGEKSIEIKAPALLATPTA
jgi:hypothetical protein